MIEVDDNFRRSVVSGAEAYLGAPPATLGLLKYDSSTIELGTTPESGFNCSGLVLRSIADAIKKGSLADVCRPDYRRSIDIVKNLGGEDELEQLSRSQVRPGDIVAHIDQEYPPGGGPHLMIATAEMEQGRMPYIHAVRITMLSSGVIAKHGVMRGNLRTRMRDDFLRIPLDLLVDKAFRLDI